MADKTKCPHRGCKIPKEEWQKFCWAHWHDLPKDLRCKIVQYEYILKQDRIAPAERRHYKEMLKGAMAEAKLFLKEKRKPLNPIPKKRRTKNGKT